MGAGALTHCQYGVWPCHNGLTPFIDDLLNRIVPLLIGVGPYTLEWIGPIHVRAAITNIDEWSMCVVHSHSACYGAQICIGDGARKHPVQDLLRSLHALHAIVRNDFPINAHQGSGTAPDNYKA